jgi:hypothetical protein
MNEKEEWVIAYLKSKESLQFVDMLDENFVGEFIEEFEVESQFTGIGAVKCKELSKLLCSMYKKGLLDRFPHGVKSGLFQEYRNYNSPKWVYSYKLKSK